MECPLGDIDLNRVQTDILSDGETHAQDHGSAQSKEDGLGTVVTIESINGVQMQQIEVASTQPEQVHEEPEEGEISDDNNHGASIPENEDKPESPECDDAAESFKERSPTRPRVSVASHDKWSHRSNGHGRHGGWNLRSEPSTYPGQPDKFYQFAWAQGIQGSSKDSLGDSLQEETKSKKTGDNNRSLHRSSSADRKSGWIVGDRGIEYVKLMRSDDGYLYLHEEGDRSDQRRDGRKGRSEKGSAERASMSRSTSDKSSREGEEKYRNHSDERSSTHEREYRRRSDSRRSSRDSRKRESRGEGELEEGEIEAKQAMMAELNRYSKSRDRHLEKPSLSSLSKGITGSESPAHNFMSESHKDKLFTDITEYVRNVAVKDAQKSFMSVCRQLRRALRTLRDLHRDLSRAQGKHIEGQQRKVLALTRDAFSGIRAAYAVRNTAIGKEQEQDTNAFPRLLELARSRCQNLFTSKQIQELESMMQAIGYRNRTDFLLKSHKRGYETERREEKDVRIGDSSGNTSATTQLETESSTDNSANDRTLGHGDEAEQPLNPSVGLHHGEISMAHAINTLDCSTAGTVGFGGWFSLTPEQGDAQGYGDAKEGLIPAQMMGSIVDLNEDQSKNLTPEMGAESRTDKLGSVILRDAQAVPNKEHTFTPHFDPVRALTSYHEKFAGKSQTVYARLPSPTPSDEEGEGANSVNDVAARVGFSEGQQAGKEVQVPDQSRFFPPVISSHQGSNVPIKENLGRSTPPELTLFPSLEPPPLGEDGRADGLQAKLGQLRGSKKSRDPRRRLVSQPFDLELLQPDTVGNEGSERTQWSQEGASAHSRESTGPNQESSQVRQENLPSKGELVSLTLATGGGWLAEQQTGTSSKETAVNVAAVDTGSLDSVSNFLDDVSQKKRQMEFLNEESSSKRQKVSVISKEGDDIAQPKVSIDLETSVLGDELKQGVVSETLSSQGATSLKNTASTLESMVKDLPKPRMKPRDPRRALLGSILEKSKTLTLAAVKSESISAASSSAVSNSAAQVSGDAIGTTSLSISTRNLMDKPLGGVSTLADAWPSSVVKNENLPAIGSSGMPHVSDSICSNSKPDDLLRTSKATAVETKMAVIKPPTKFDLNVSAAANSKQQNINHWDHLEPLLEGLDERQKQAVRQERARRIEEQSRMFVAKKLCLVLDLDHTLLNSAKFTEIEGEWEAKLQANELTERNKFSKEGTNRRELYRFQHMGMWTKLRPGIWNFLARASHLYELHVYTMGNKAYATEMAKLLDPTGALFAGRVISKGDDGDITDGDERPPKSKDLDGVLGMESAVVIIDDSARVWPHHRHNLIVVERYMYFPCSRKQFGLPGPSLLEVGHDEREQDGMLASALMVIEKIHYSFFSNPRLNEVDVRDILAKEQRRVLAGCKLVFSRVFPQGEIQPHLHPLWQLAEQFGAVCSINIDDGVTHVVAISLGTEKVNWALSTGRFVVRPSWLEASAILYRRASERDFSVSP